MLAVALLRNLAKILERGFHPSVVAGIVDQNGKAKYTGLHGLRHFFASWWIKSQGRRRPRAAQQGSARAPRPQYNRDDDGTPTGTVPHGRSRN